MSGIIRTRSRSSALNHTQRSKGYDVVNMGRCAPALSRCYSGCYAYPVAGAEICDVTKFLYAHAR